MSENLSLTAKQARFVDEYLIDLNATAAAKRAGYKDPNKGRQLVTKSNVSIAIQERMKERRERTGLNQDYVLNNLTEVVERCMQRRPVMSGGKQVQDDEGRSVWAFDARGTVRALELLGKHLGMFTDKVEHSGDMGVSMRGEVRAFLLERERGRKAGQAQKTGE